MAKLPKKETTTNIALDMAKIFLDIQTSSFNSGIQEGKRLANLELADRIDEKLKIMDERIENLKEEDPFSNFTDNKLDKHIEATEKLMDGDDK